MQSGYSRHCLNLHQRARTQLKKKYPLSPFQILKDPTANATHQHQPHRHRQNNPAKFSAEPYKVILTPSAAKLFPRPARLQHNTEETVYQNENENSRQVRNMLSQWQAQQRAAALATELDDNSPTTTVKEEPN